MSIRPVFAEGAGVAGKRVFDYVCEVSVCVQNMRIDKYMWAIRLFKSRTEASEACSGGRVKAGGVSVKPSHEIKPGDVISVRKGAVLRTYRVIAPVERRVGAALVPNYAEDLTPQSEIDKMRAPVETVFVKRDRGSGRPTKKERRDLDALWDDLEGE